MTDLRIRSINDEAVAQGVLKDQRFTDSAIRLFRDVKERAVPRGLLGRVPILLVLWSLLRSEKKLGAYTIEHCGVDLWSLEKDIDTALGALEPDDTKIRNMRDSNLGVHCDYAEIANVALASRKEATVLNTRCVGTEHVVLALCKCRDASLQGVLDKYGITYEKVRRNLEDILR